MIIKNWLLDLVTDSQGKADEMATLCICSALTYLGTGTWAVVVNHQTFDAQAWGIGLGALIGGVSAGMGMKAHGEKS